MDNYDKELIEEFGFQLDSESPLEISIPSITPSVATGHCAQMILNHLANLKDALTNESSFDFIRNQQEDCENVKNTLKDLKAELDKEK